MVAVGDEDVLGEYGVAPDSDDDHAEVIPDSYDDHAEVQVAPDSDAYKSEF